jgi:hypothetical protein
MWIKEAIQQEITRGRIPLHGEMHRKRQHTNKREGLNFGSPRPISKMKNQRF